MIRQLIANSTKIRSDWFCGKTRFFLARVLCYVEEDREGSRSSCSYSNWPLLEIRTGHTHVPEDQGLTLAALCCNCTVQTSNGQRGDAYLHVS
ncbi:hypothetical protein KM043_013572 [Ampulex compressa]|nr:hypothetical protein KM043_013572 [Ampulex compressa]